ncbi:hypothetical protein ABPG75_010977 [Micractinium tetrahymenae]
MAGRHPPLLLWAPSRLVRELRAFCLAELEQQWVAVASMSSSDAATDPGAPPQQLPPLAAEPLGGSGGGLTARLACPTDQQTDLLPRLLAATQQCTLLTAAIQPLAAASTLEAAAASVTEQVPAGEAAAHPLRILAAASSSARAPAERFLRHRFLQLGLGSRPVAGRPPLWCIQYDASKQAAAGSEMQHAAANAEAPQWQRQREQEHTAGARRQKQEQPGEQYLLALELAAGRPPTAVRRLGPTAMLPELAALTASLAAVQPGAAVLDPFCGTGSLLLAALRRGAALAVGSDIDDTHFGGTAASRGATGQADGCSSGSRGSSRGSSSSVWTGLPGSCALIQADAAGLHSLLPAASVDAVLTDLPYGYRTTVGVSGAASSGTSRGDGSSAEEAAAAAAQPEVGTEDDWQQLLGVLLRLAVHVLVPGGRLLVWLPCWNPGSPQQQQHELAGAVLGQGLCLLHFLPESRQGGYPRAAALFRKQPASSNSSSSRSPEAASGPDTRRAALEAALQAAEASGVPVHLPAGQAAAEPTAAADEGAPAGGGGAAPDAALQRRGVKYKQARAQAFGTAIDVWRAAWLGDVAAVREYAAAGGDINAQDRKKQTPMQFAAGYGREAVVPLLLDLGADPNAAADASGMAALHRAAARNHAAVLRRLLAAGADPWQRSAAGQTPLMYASQFGHEEAVATLLAHLAADEHDAVGRAAVVTTDKALPAAEASAEQQQQEQQQQQPGNYAAAGNASGSALARHLALTDGAGLSALHLAAQWGMEGVAEQLLAAGADPNPRSACERQLSPAHLAARWGHPAVLQVLQRHGGDLEARCGELGWTPLQEAEEWRRGSCVELLRGEGLAQGCDGCSDEDTHCGTSRGE